MFKFLEHVKKRLYALAMNLMTENRLARRASMMETARQMIAEKGYEAITIRDLAEACRVSVPTLYNQFGGKDQLLAAAIEDHFVGDPDQVNIKSSLDGLDRIFATLDAITHQFLQAPEFHRRLLEAFGSLDSTQRVQRSITVSLAQEIARELAIMQAREELVAWVDTTLLAGQVTTAFVSSTIVWGSGGIREDHLTASVQYATGLVLAGVVSKQASSSLQERIVSAQALLRDSMAESLADNEDLAGSVSEPSISEPSISEPSVSEPSFSEPSFSEPSTKA